MYRIPSYIPVVFHNLAGYDTHLFIKELAKNTTNINVIAKNTENYISFSVKVEVDRYIDKAGNEKVKEMELRFIDSFKFMSSSLDSLVNNLAKGGHQFPGFENYNSEQRELLIKKGVYPFEYMNSWDKFEETHRVIQFKQSAWMKEYIDFNTSLRTAAKNNFKKDFYKLMNNSVFGKTMENIRRHRDIKSVNNKEDYLKQVMKSNFKSGCLLGTDLMNCEMGKVRVKMNKPVYLGQAILDLSKTIMYEFHYDYMKKKYSEKT